MADVPNFRDDIDDALRRGGADRLPASSNRRARPVSPRRSRLPFDPRPTSPAQVALVAIILIVVAYFRVLGVLSGLAMNAGLALLAIAAISWFVRPRRRTVRWREREIDLTPELSWIEKLYYVIYRGT